MKLPQPECSLFGESLTEEDGEQLHPRETTVSDNDGDDDKYHLGGYIHYMSVAMF